MRSTPSDASVQIVTCIAGDDVVSRLSYRSIKSMKSAVLKPILELQIRGVATPSCGRAREVCGCRAERRDRRGCRQPDVVQGGGRLDPGERAAGGKHRAASSPCPGNDLCAETRHRD
eukprot:736429-Hanusia_phi.AAC.4